jgi:uncharacterized protein YbjT (DUF2867 family)
MTILIFGATGSAGGSVLRACLDAPEVDQVRALVRRDPRLRHPKLQLRVHQDFADYRGAGAAFAAVDACFYCLGKSVRQVSGEAEYRVVTHDYAVAAARALRDASPGAAFQFVSGSGAHLDSRFMWARVKAETERDLIALCGAVCWRPAAIDGMPSASEPALYRRLRPVFRLLRPFRGLYVHGEDIGRAMLQATADGWRGRIVENAALRDLADRWRAAHPAAG